MMCRVTQANSSDGSASAEQNEQGVLANLPRTRPQRASRRRAAARNATRGPGGTAAAPAHRGDLSRPRKRTADSSAAGADAGRATAARTAPGKLDRSTASRPRASVRGGAARRTSVPRRSRTSGRDAAPRQGFECDGDAASGPVQPPGAAELVASAAEIVGELAKAGLSRSERLLKDFVSRLPLS